MMTSNMTNTSNMIITTSINNKSDNKGSIISAKNVTLKYGDFTALKSINLSINERKIFGLVGSNGSGKSSLLRAITGIYEPDEGEVLIDGIDIFESPEVREAIAYVPDELYCLPNTTMNSMAKHYKRLHPSFDHEYYDELVKKFDIDSDKLILSMSKGLKRLATLILALACRPMLLIVDEVFDGLDNIKRSQMKDVLYDEAWSRDMSVIMATHSIKEVVDTCDSVAIMHNGQIMCETEITSPNIENTNYVKYNISFSAPISRSDVEFEGANIISFKTISNDSVNAEVVYANPKEVVEKNIKAKNPNMLEAVPISLEELFGYICNEPERID